MSFSIPPSKSEVLSWKPQTLANYMEKHKLSGCEKVVIKQNITGEHFLKMSECDLRVFPGHYIEKLKEFQKATSNRRLSLRANNNPNPRQAAAAAAAAAAAVDQQEEDYEAYVMFQEPNESVYDNEVKDLLYSLTKMKLQQNNNLYQDASTEPCSVKSKTKTKRSKSEGSVRKDLSFSCSQVPSINYSLIETKRQTQPLPAQNSESKEALDPRWYGGGMSRRQAEAALTQAEKDGAFVVRDSSKGRAEHPYTLMVLKEAKVYNIKIRKQGHLFFLGSGLHNDRSFPGVREIITHHAHTPLLLIDAKDCGSETQRPQCRLLHPAKAQQ